MSRRDGIFWQILNEISRKEPTTPAPQLFQKSRGDFRSQWVDSLEEISLDLSHEFLNLSSES
jgi:hypothetical protein